MDFFSVCKKRRIYLYFDMSLVSSHVSSEKLSFIIWDYWEIIESAGLYLWCLETDRTRTSPLGSTLSNFSWVIRRTDILRAWITSYKSHPSLLYFSIFTAYVQFWIFEKNTCFGTCKHTNHYNTVNISISIGKWSLSYIEIVRNKRQDSTISFRVGMDPFLLSHIYVL